VGSRQVRFKVSRPTTSVLYYQITGYLGNSVARDLATTPEEPIQHKSTDAMPNVTEGIGGTFTNYCCGIGNALVSPASPAGRFRLHGMEIVQIPSIPYFPHLFLEDC
jgi:hypothetical protein